MAAVSLNNVSIAFGANRVIDRLSLDIEEGEFVVLLGPSGCGKSTLLNAIAGLLDVEEGQIFIAGRNVTWEEPKDRGIAMVFQSYALYPRMSVRQNMSFGLRMAHTPRAEIDRRVRRAADMLQIAHLLDRRPDQLSGGQRQRVAIGRALVRDASVFLFDEPLSNLDAQLRNELRLEIKRLHMDLGSTTMVYVTHDQIEAMTLADRIVVMRDRAIQQLGTPADLYHRPENLFVAGFVGSPKMNFIEGRVENGDGAPQFCAGSVRLPLGDGAAHAVPPGRPVTLGVRPEHIALGEGPWEGFRIDIVEPLGADSLVWARNGGTALQLRLPGDTPVRPGEPVTLRPDAARVSLFDTETGRRI